MLSDGTGAGGGRALRRALIPCGGRGTRMLSVTGGAPSAFTGVGRYVFEPDAMTITDEVEATLPRGAELDDVPVMQLLLARDRLVGRRIPGRFLDLGLPDGYRQAEHPFATRSMEGSGDGQ